MSDAKKPDLVMTFDPSTIEHLGIRMYSTLPPVMAELVANAYDADARKVTITLFDGDEKRIVVSDNGDGMSYSEINDSFLRIGRNRRNESADTTKLGRRVIGKKGLGKLSFFGMSDCVEISTVKDGLKNVFEMNLSDILQSSSQVYKPKVLVYEEASKDDSGTTIVLHNVKRRTDFSAKELAISLSRFFYMDDEFTIEVRRNNESFIVSEELRMEGMESQFEWRVPDEADVEEGFFERNSIMGRILASGKPISPEMRGITLYSRGKLVNTPSSFVEGDSSHFYSYMTGYLDVSYLDLLPEDLVTTNRQSLNWDKDEAIVLKRQLSGLVKKLERSWREKRKHEKEKKAKEQTGVDIGAWISSNANETQAELAGLVDDILKASETHSEKAASMIKRVHDLVPEYARYHWRHLHEEVQQASRQYYEVGNYYTAVLESTKRYVAKVKRISASPLTQELAMLQNVFQESNPVLKVTMGYSRSDGSDFEPDTLKNIESGNRGFAVAVWQGVRDPLNHEEIMELNQSDLFTEADCLDALSLLSHLFRRLEHAQVVRSA